MTARDIQRRLIVERYQRSICMPNWTPPSWWESDVYELTAAGYAREYEIKLTRSDFKADTNKKRSHWVGGERTEVSKHKLLSTRSALGPSRFYFVCPEHVIEEREIPSWAGLIWAHEHKNNKPPWNIRIFTVKPAPQLHRVKAAVTHKRTIEASCYYRFLRLFLHQ